MCDSAVYDFGCILDLDGEFLKVDCWVKFLGYGFWVWVFLKIVRGDFEV